MGKWSPEHHPRDSNGRFMRKADWAHEASKRVAVATNARQPQPNTGGWVSRLSASMQPSLSLGVTPGAALPLSARPGGPAKPKTRPVEAPAKATKAAPTVKPTATGPAKLPAREANRPPAAHPGLESTLAFKSIYVKDHAKRRKDMPAIARETAPDGATNIKVGGVDEAGIVTDDQGRVVGRARQPGAKEITEGGWIYVDTRDHGTVSVWNPKGQDPTLRRPAGPKVVPASTLKPGNRVSLAGYDQYGKPTHVSNGYVQSAPTRVRIRQGRGSKAPVEDYIAVQMAEKRSGANGWRTTVYVKPDAMTGDAKAPESPVRSKVPSPSIPVTVLSERDAAALSTRLKPGGGLSAGSSEERDYRRTVGLIRGDIKAGANTPLHRGNLVRDLEWLAKTIRVRGGDQNEIPRIQALINYFGRSGRG